MKSLKLSTDRHDLAVENYNLVIIDGEDRVRQHLRTRLWFFKGEWFLDTTYGLDYFQFIGLKNPNLGTVASVIKATILDTPEVNSLLEYSQEFNTQQRTLTVTFTVDTTYGPITISEEL